MAFDVQAALKAGYSEGEIAEYLGQQQRFDAVAAMNSGYTPREIIKHLTTEPKAAPFSLTDVGLTGAAGAVGATRAVLQAFGPETPGVETLGEFQQSLLGMRTPERQAEVARRAALEQQAAKSGTPLEEIGAFLGGIKEAPIQSIAQGVGSTVPALLTGAAALVVGAPLGIAAAVGIGARFLFGALQGAGEVKGTIYDNVFKELKAQGIPEDQAKIQAEAAQDYIGKNTDNIFVGAGLGALAGGTGAERVLGNYVAKKIGVDLATGAAKKEAEGLIMRGVKEALKEGIPEGLQGGQEQFASNVALGREGIEMPEFQGVLGSAARDAAIGALTGGVVSPFGRQRAEAPVPEAQRPLEKLGPEQLTALRDQYVEAETELNRLAEAAKAPDLTPEQKTAAVNAFIDYKNNTFAPLRAEFARYRTQIEALTPKPEVVTLPPEAAVPPTGEAPTPPVGRVEPPQRPIPPSEPSVDQPSGEPPRNTDEPPPVDEGPKSSEPPATPVEPLTGLPKPPETREFQIAKPKEQIAKEVQGMTIPELARWAVLNAPNTPAQQFALKAFERINQYADRGIFPGKINVMNASKRNLSGVRGAVGYRYYTTADRKPLVSSGFDISLRLNGLDEQGRADDLTGTRYSTILHELLHAATHLQIDLDPNSKPVKELNNLFNRVKAQIKVDIKKGVQNPALDAIRRGANTMKNVHELVSWGLTDKNFQDYLATIKVGEKTAFTKFVEIMRKLLNVNPEFESALDSLMRSSENLLSTPVKKIERGAGAPLKGAGITTGEPAKRVALPKPPKPPEGEEPPAPPPKPPEGEEPPGGIKLEPGKPFTRPKLPPLGPKPPELDISNVRLSKKPPEQGGRDPQVQAAAMLLAEGKMTREEYEKYVDHYRAIYPINIDALLPPSTVDAMRGALRGDVAKARLNTVIKDGTRVGLRMDLPALDKGVPVVSIHEGRPNADKKGRPYRSAGDVISYASTGYIKNVFFAPRDQDLSLKMGYMPEGKNPLQTAEGEWVNMTPEDVYKRVKELKNDPAWVQVGFDPHRHGYFYDRKTREPVAKADEMFQIGNFLLAKNVKYAPKEDFLYETGPVEEGQPPILDTADIKPMKGRHPQVMAAARMLRDGKISREEFDKYVNFYKPIVAIEEGKLEPPPSVETIKGKIDSNLQKFVGAPIEDGTKVGLRLDIKARDRGASVVTVHGGMAGKSNRGPLLSYLGTGYIKDVTFEPRSQARGLAVAAGGEKFPLQTSEGTWVNVPPAEVFKRVKQLMNDPSWTQVGFDPTRHGYFYDRKTKAPVVSASEMYQVGNFLLAKDVKYSTAEEFLYETAERPATVEMEVSPLGFFSALTEQAKKLNIKATEPQNWKTALKGLVNRGLVKNEEIEWTGVNDWLDLQQGKVTKEQLISYLRDNGVKVEEVVLGEPQHQVRWISPKSAKDQGLKESGYVVVNTRGKVLDGPFSSLTEAENKLDSKYGVQLPGKYGTYTLPGGENYREVLLTLPTKAAPVEGKVVKDDKDAQYPWAIIVNGKEVNRVSDESVANDVLEEELARARKQIGRADKSVFRSGHWDQPNVLAHIRMNDRTDADGNRVLFIEEIQSDWGQERKKNLQMAAETGSQMVREGAEMKTPAAPFITKTEGWLNLALKRIMIMAAEGGYDKVAFVNGDQSANRYDLSKQVGSVYYAPGDRAGVGKGTLIAMPVGKTITSSSRPVLEKDDVGPEEIEAYVGKEIAKNLLASPIVDGFHSVSGEGLKVGGEGMKAFYDKIVPLAVKKLLPKMGGGQMETVNIQTRDNRLAVVERDDGFRIMDLNANIGSDLLDGVYSTRADAEAAMNAMLRGNQPGFDITPSMMGRVPVSVELFEQGDIGPRAVDIIGKLGMGVQPPQPGFIQQSKANLKFALENPKLTRESAKKATIGFLDRIETATFSSSSAFDNQLRRAVADDIKGNEEVIGMLIDASQSQAVHADALASQFIIEGGLRYDEEYKKWVAYKEPDNFVELGKQVNEIAKKYNISEDEARRVTHTYFMAKRLRSLQERNAKDKERIEELKAERSEATTKAEKEKINREIERLKDREAFIHMDDPEIDLGLSLGEMMPELEGVTKTWNGIRRNARRVLVNSGLWTEEYADQMLDVIDYVPFYREVQLEENQGPREFVRGLQVAAKEHRLKGTNKPVNDILDNMVRWTQYAVNRSVRNDKAVRMVDVARNIDMGDGTKMAERVEKAERGMNIVRIWRDGQQELYNMADPLFADAFTGIQSVALDMYPMASKFANTLRDSVVLFPLFSVAQVPQDAFAAMFSSGLQPQYALRIPILAVKEFIKTLNKSSQTHEILKKFGAVGVRDFNSTVIRDDAEVFAGIKAPPGVKAKIKEYLQHIAMSADNSIRQAVYEASVQQGLTKAEALEKAFEVINFRRRGTNKAFQLAGQTIPFFYAYLAAQRVAYNTLTGTGISPQDRKAAWKTLMYTSASVMTLSFLYAMMAADDEDYKNTPAAIRDRTLTIPGTGGLRIPLRTDFFLFPKIVAEHTYLLLTDKGYEDPAKFRKSLFNALGEALFSPTLVPQVVKPIVEAGINYDFFQGRPILGQYEKQKEWSRQFNETTSEFSKLMGQTGLVSPIMADHLIRGFLGTTGGLFLWFTNTAINKSGLMGVEAPEKTWREAVEAIPGTSGFLKRTNESALRNDFYELREKVSVAAATFNDIKKNNPQGIKEYLEDEKRMARLIVSKQVENVNKRLAELRARIRQITEAPTTMMTATEKGEAIRQLRQIEQQIYEAINVKGMREKAKL